MDPESRRTNRVVGEKEIDREETEKLIGGDEVREGTLTRRRGEPMAVNGWGGRDACSESELSRHTRRWRGEVR